MADEPEKTPIRTAYAKRYADDLEANRKEQADLNGRIAVLQDSLEQLRVNEAWLEQALGSLPAEIAPTARETNPTAGEAPAPSAAVASAVPVAVAVADEHRTVPQPRQDKPAKAVQSKRPAKKAAAKKTGARRAAAAKKPVAETPSAAAAPAEAAPAVEAPAKERTGPPLRELILTILLKTPGEPHTAREVADRLAQDHPDRATSVQTVRNTLENLAKKNDAVEKSHQQGSVMYLANPDPEDTAPAAHTTADHEDEPTAEKAPAKV